jgi:hypothetical protein
MTQRVFFSFYYQDVIDLRVDVVRQHWFTKPEREAAGFFDASLWENAKLSGEVDIKRVINSGLEGTSTTCVLVGSETYKRRWVRYEIMKSFRRGNALLSVHINSIKGRDQLTKPQGLNPLSFLGVTFSKGGFTATLWESTAGVWREYDEIDGGSSYETGGVGVEYQGKSFRLAQWYPAYDWLGHNGYQNLSAWVS